MKNLLLNKGGVVFREGETGGSLYRVLQGSVDVVAGCGTAQEKKLTTLEKGRFFGELGSFEGYLRSATVLAAEDNTIVEEIPDDEIDQLFQKDHGTILAVMKQMSSRMRELTDEYVELTGRQEQAAPEKKEGGFLERFMRILRGNNETIQSRQEAKKDLKDGYSCRVESFPKGKIVFREGDAGSCMYCVHSGSVGIYTGYGTPEETKLTDVYTNHFFGEMGMIDEAPRTATAVILEPGTTLETIYPKDLEELFEKNPFKVLMIVQNLSGRVRRLSTDVAEARKKLG